MNTIKAFAIAAAGAALIAAVPASAQSYRSYDERAYAPPAQSMMQQVNPFNWLQPEPTYNTGYSAGYNRGYVAGDTYGQIRLNQLKDSSTYNGNSY